jgi:glycosyltransferase involved in cell wall biosynthesis
MAIKISVVVPTYRRPLLLQKCLHRLQQQSFNKSEYEVIVVSDGYDASTEKLVRECQQDNTSIFYDHLPQKKGPAAARNKGWQKARGILIAFTDDDCLPHTHWLQAFWQAYTGEAEIAFTGQIKVPVTLPPTDYEKNLSQMEMADFLTANCCCTKKALEKVGGFDEEFSMAWREDSDLEFKLLLAKIPIHYKVDAVVVHPARQVPWGISIKEQKKSMYNALLYKKYPELYRRKIQKVPRWDYYFMLLSLLLVMAGIMVQHQGIALTAFLVWLVLVIRFIFQRLSATSKAPGHVAEMVATSLVIPLVSVYWKLYGSWKFKVLFL